MLEGKILFLTRKELESFQYLRNRYAAYWIFVQEEDGSVTKCKDRWDDGTQDAIKLEIVVPSH